MEERIVKAAKKYLEIRFEDHCILDEVDDFIVVYSEPDDVLIFVFVSEDGFDRGELRKDFEKTIVKYFADHDEFMDIEVRCDVLEFLMVDGNRAVIRHTINAFR